MTANTEKTTIAQSIDSTKVQNVEVASISFDTAITIRFKQTDGTYTHADTVASYRETIAELPPVVVYKVEDGTMLLVDGFHRYRAYEAEGIKQIPAYVYEGKRVDALTFAATANLRNGLQITREETKAAARRLFGLGKSQSEVATLMMRPRQWVSELAGIMEVENVVPRQSRAKAKDAVLVAVRAAEETQWTPLMKVAGASSWTAEDTRRAAKLVDSDAEARAKLAVAAESGGTLSVVGKDGAAKLVKLHKSPKATPDPKAAESPKEKGDGTPEYVFSVAMAAIRRLQGISPMVVAEHAVAPGQREQAAETIKGVIDYLLELQDAFETYAAETAETLEPETLSETDTDALKAVTDAAETLEAAQPAETANGVVATA